MRRNVVSPLSLSFFSPRPLILAAAICLAGPSAWSADEPPVIVALRERVELGDAEAMMALGDAYARGDGVLQDHVEAFRCYQRAAALDHAPALFSVAVMMETGQGIPVDVPGAYRTYLKAAEQGWPPAQLRVGDMLASGVGTTRNEAAAVGWYRKAAMNGVAEAQYDLGVAYEQGRGIPKDREQAQKWYREAADRGYDRARFNLALMLESGLGSGSDAGAAAELYRTAAEHGFAPAQNNYGLLLAEGRGSVPIDLVESFAWLTIAVENGANPAGRNLVGRKLNPEQLAAAHERAGSLRSALAASDAAAASVVTRAPLPIATVELAPLSSEEIQNSAESSSKESRKPDGTLAVRAAWGQEVSALKAEILSLSTEVKDLSESNNSLRAEQERLTGENLRLATALREIENQPPPTPPQPEVPAEWTKEKENLEAQLQEGMTKLASAEQRITDFEAREKLHREVEARSSAQATQNAELTSRIQLLTDDNEKLRGELTQLTKEQGDLVAAAEAASKSRQATTPVAWQSEREALRVEVQLLKDRLADAEQQMVQLKQSADQAVRSHSTATENAEKARAELAGTMALASRVPELEASLQKLTNDNAVLQQQLASKFASPAGDSDTSELKDSLAAAQRRIVELESSAPPLGDVMRELSALRSENARLRNMAQTQHAELRNQVAALQYENVMSAARLREAQGLMEQIAADTRSASSAVVTFEPVRPSTASISVPARSGGAAVGSRMHTVLPGESLIRISVRYYGTGNRWQEIYQANRDALRGQTKIRVGQRLRVP